MTDERIVAFAEAQERRRRRGPPSSRNPDLPLIRLAPGGLADEVNAVEAALIAAGKDLYVYGGRLVEPVWTDIKVSAGRKDRSLQLREAPVPRMLYLIAESVRFEQFSKLADDWIPASCPHTIAETLVAMGTWPFPTLTSVVSTPTLREHDYSVISEHGYDAASGTLFHPNGTEYGVVPDAPDRAECLAAMARLKAPIRHFPFITDADRSVALSAMLTVVVRSAVPTAPLHAFSSPVPGSGKSKLNDIAAILGTGHRAPVVSFESGGKEEIDKTIRSLVLSGVSIIAIDNVESVLGNELINQVLTQERLSIRLLGSLRVVESANRLTMFANGNNLTIADQVTRRALRGCLDPKEERPELLEFEFEPEEYVLEHRARMVVDALTCIRGRVALGREPFSVLGSFSGWSYLVRDTLTWLGEADPVVTQDEMRGQDPKVSGLRAVLDQLAAVYGTGRRVTVRDIVADANRTSSETQDLEHPDLRDALAAVAHGRGSEAVSAERLGWWFRRNQSRVVDGRRIVRDDSVVGHSAGWRVEDV